jgi:hypothetical protein
MATQKSHVAVVAFLLCIAVTGHTADRTSALQVFSARENRFWTAFQKQDVDGFKKMVTDDYLNIDYAGEIATVSEFAVAMPAWVKRQGHWVASHYQETPVQPQ